MSIFDSTTPAMRRTKLGVAGALLLGIGAVAGGAVAHEFRPAIQMAPTHTVPIARLATSDGIVTIKGRVAESFGSRLVIDDGSGRALVDAGPRNEGGTLTPLGSVVSVQGRYDRGSFHPSFLVDPSGTVSPLGPPPGHHHGGHGRPGHEDRDDRGPDQGPPPPPAPMPEPGPAATH